jgi:sec-independent protein translocase protein TatB
MFDIGLGEIIILAVIGLLVFGPEKLPRAAADAARTIRNLRAMASTARQDLADSAGLDLTDAKDTLRSIADLHPKRMVAGLLDDEPTGPGNAPKGQANGSASTTDAPKARFDPDAT